MKQNLIVRKETKMKDNEIIKTLKCHIKRHCWDDCPNATGERQLLGRPCSQMIAEDALDLINRQKGEIERLKTAYETLKQEYDSMFSANRNLMAEVERLKKTIVDLNANLSESVNCFTRMETLYKIKCKELEVAKSEAYKEFAEMLKEKSDRGFWQEHSYVDVEDIDNTLKELTEKNDKE